MKRNTIVLCVTLVLLAIFAWAGWANWEYRKQAAAKRAAAAALKTDLAAAGDPDAEFTRSPLLGKPAPAFNLEDLSGQKVTLDNYKGKALLINFWATWCGPCKLETPWLVELRNQYASKGFEILGVDSEDDEVTPDDKAGWAKDRASVVQFVQQEHMPYPVLLNGDSISQEYGGFEAMPTSFFVDRSGKVISMQMGITSKDDMEMKIKQMLGE
ncbi:MAG TPA: TlpA disulfide reductase family protein [Terracidiphilus sp.]|nr:TlpA disulfide reductase family protein [Terracidiphilus sp.]